MIMLTIVLSIALLNAQELETMDDISTESELQTSTEALIESSSEPSSEDLTDSTNSSTVEISIIDNESASSDSSTNSSTVEIPIIDNESASSDSHKSEPTEEMNSTNSDVAITSEFSGFDYKQTLNGSDFSCYSRSFGQYADVAKDCHVFHLCYPFFNSKSDELLYQRITFLCNNESVFDQKRFICAENSTVDHKCDESPQLYDTTNQEYLIKVFSQNVSPIDELKGETESGDSDSSSNPSWFNWLYSN